MSDKTTITNGIITLSGEDLNKFKTAIKIGFYRNFYKKGIINSEQFERLMQLQNENQDKSAA